VTEKLVPVFSSGELAKLERACQGRTFAQRRDYAIICVFRATGVRLSELAGIRYDPDNPVRSDLDLWQREITVTARAARRGKAACPQSVTGKCASACCRSGSGGASEHHRGVAVHGAVAGADPQEGDEIAVADTAGAAVLVQQDQGAGGRGVPVVVDSDRDAAGW